MGITPLGYDPFNITFQIKYEILIKYYFIIYYYLFISSLLKQKLKIHLKKPGAQELAQPNSSAYRYLFGFVELHWRQYKLTPLISHVMHSKAIWVQPEQLLFKGFVKLAN